MNPINAFFDGACVPVVFDSRLTSSFCPSSWFSATLSHIPYVYPDSFELSCLVR